MKRKVLFILIIVALASMAYLLLRRTPHSIANVLSPVKIDKSFSVIEFEDDWLPNGDGHSYIVFQADKAKLNQFVSSLKLSGFQPLPIPDSISRQADVSRFDYLKEGFYSISIDRADTRNYTLCAFSTVSNQYIICNEIY